MFLIVVAKYYKNDKIPYVIDEKTAIHLMNICN